MAHFPRGNHRRRARLEIFATRLGVLYIARCRPTDIENVPKRTCLRLGGHSQIQQAAAMFLQLELLKIEGAKGAARSVGSRWLK